MTPTALDQKNAVAGDVAIVGMACLFPSAATLGTYWENIVFKRCAIGDPPEDWEAERYFDKNSKDNDRTYCKKGGYLGDLAHFNPLEFGVMPSSLDGGEPDHYLALKLARDALVDAGYTEKTVNPERTEVIVGRGTYINRGVTNSFQHTVVVDQTLEILQEVCPGLTDKNLQQIKEKLKKNLPPFNAETVQSLVPNILTGRIANRLNFMGPNYLVDAACASSLIAVEHGIRDLRAGKCDVALVGGVNASLPPTMLVIFSQIEVLSRKQQLIPFDESADGTMLGEGLGFVVLKRKGDAERDGDRIYAILKSVGVSSDGRAIGLLAPRVEGEALAIKHAYDEACLSPGTIELIEAHGTGTSVGDVAEIKALRKIFGEGNGGRPNCALGTVKSMIGHLIPASGIASIIKTALALYHKVLPPTICERPNPSLELDKTSFYINTETRPWIHGNRDYPRRAGVNAFGFGGINAHAILEEYTASNESCAESFCTTWENEVFLFQGQSRHDLINEMSMIRDYVQANPDIHIKDLAYSLNIRDVGSSCKLAIIAGSGDVLSKKINNVIKRLKDPSCKRIRVRSGIYFFDEPLGNKDKVAFLFPGEGSQYINMLSDLCIHFPEVRAIFDLVDRAFVDHKRGYLPSHSVYPLPLDQDKSAERFWAMDSAAESVFAANMAMLAIMKCLEIKPDVLLGHSTGEYSAILASGMLDVEKQEQFIDFVLGVNKVFEDLAEKDQIAEGVLLSVGAASSDLINEIVEQGNGSLYITMDNCPQQTILCGPDEVIAKAEGILRKSGAILERLPFSRAYHTPLFKPICTALLHYFKDLKINAPAIKIYSCASVQPYPDDADEIRELATSQWARKVCFTDSIKSLYEDGVRIFLEVGPKGNLISFVDNILQKKTYLAIASNLKRRSGITQLNHLVGLLAAQHIHVNPSFLYKHRQPVRLPFDSANKEQVSSKKLKKSVKIDLTLPRLQLKDFSGMQQIMPDNKEKCDTSFQAHASPLKLNCDTKSQVMLEYLHNMKEFLNSQNDVTQAYLEREKNILKDGEATGVLSKDNLPFIREILSFVPGQHVECLCELSSREDVFLLDHTLGATVSAFDKTITALPIVPLTFSMEIMGEAASLLMDGKKLIGMREVRAYRWIGLDKGGKALKIHAQEMPSNGEVKVAIYNQKEDNHGKEKPVLPIIEGTMIFADDYPDIPPAEMFSLANVRKSKWKRAELYSGFMFHGPSLQGVHSMDSCGDNGATATLAAMPVKNLFSSVSKPEFFSDPVMLDAAGQVIAYWTSDCLKKAYHIFPFRLEALWMYGSRLQEPERAHCRAKIELIDDTRVRSDIDIVDSEGKLRMRMLGWWDRRFDQPDDFFKLRVHPQFEMLSVRWEENSENAGIDEHVSFRIIKAFSTEFLTAHDRIWLRVLAHLVLSRKERNYFYGMGGADKRRIEWLLGRTAAKDAVRQYLKKNERIDVFPADIEIGTDNSGKPVITSINGQGPRPELSISISHSAGVAFAGAGKSRHGIGLGVDIEVDSALAENFEQTAFSKEERELLSDLVNSQRNEWAIRFWCAKEAASKALGIGLMGSRGDFQLKAVDRRTGAIEVEITEELAPQLPDTQDRNITVKTFREDNIIIAISP